ncbi:hypothetical protein DL93DRAFT_2173976 [Clavulina sp. PMI_390]|nr:hypothetical protein DL93DRAFT_2173976 [Clavulina sp. PMI_390]
MSVVTANLYNELCGILLASTLFGIFTVQSMLYYQRFPRDPPNSRWLNDLDPTSKQPWYRSYYVTHAPVVGFAVHLFFLSRYWSVSRNAPVTMLLGALALSTFGSALYVVFRSYQLSSAIAVFQEELSASKLWLSFSAATDVTLAAALAVEMRRQHTGTDSVLNRLAIYGIATGGVTATVVVVELFMTLVAHRYEGFTLIVSPLGSLYITTFLAGLHTRWTLRTFIQPGSIELSTNVPRTFGAPPQNMAVTTTSVILWSDVHILSHH